MTIFLLIRHGDNDLLGQGILAGRSPGVHLNATGKKQAVALADELSGLGVRAVFSSPLERARETGFPLAERLNQPLCILDALNEIDFGEWTGKSFTDLSEDPRWRSWNVQRSTACPPAGETILAVQQRMIGTLAAISQDYSDAKLAVFSHGDPIKTVVAHCIGMPLDFLLRLRISPASISIIEMTPNKLNLICVNLTPRRVPVTD